MGSAREPRVGRQRLAARWAALFNEASNAPGMAQWGRRRDERFGAASAVDIAVGTLWRCPKSIGSRGTLRGPGPNPAAPPLPGRFLGRPRHRDHRHRHLCRRDAAARSGPVLAPFLRALLLSGIGSHSRALHALVLTFGAPARLHACTCMAGPGRAFLFHDMVVYPLRFASDSAAQLSGRGGPNSTCEVILAMFRVSDQGFVHSMTSLSPLMWAACVGAHGCASVVVYTV